MPGHNAAIASLLRQIAALLDEQGVAFKPAAYRRGAQTIENLPHDVSTFKTEKELMELPGIGPAIASKVFEYLQTGRIHTLDELLVSQGGISPDLLMVEDLGLKRVRQLQEALGIHTVADLIAAAERGKLRALPRFSELIEKKILENAKRVTVSARRFPREELVEDVALLLTTLGHLPGIERAEVAGSFRREKPTVGDIDILVVAKDREHVPAAIAALPIVKRVVAQGEKKLSFDLQQDVRVDVRFVDASQWGAALLYFTGDKEHNIALRKRAIQKGWKLNEYGLFEGERVIASKTEEEIYEKLGLRLAKPAERTGALTLIS